MVAAFLCARESRWVELIALLAAAEAAELCCAVERPEAAPTVSNEIMTTAEITAAPKTLRRRLGRRNLPLVLIESRSSPSRRARLGARSSPSLLALLGKS